MCVYVVAMACAHPRCAQVGLGAACEVARTEMEHDTEHVTRLSERLLDGLRARLPHIILNGDALARYPGNLNISFAYVEGESLLMVRHLLICCAHAATVTHAA
jgi:cysteine sulfinate desulfinase/cysteine desulfurase-like protein